jgi:transposase
VVKREKHEHYDVDFKRNAVRLSNHPNIQTKDVAGVLKIHPFMLSRWKKEYREGRYVKNGNENSAAARLEKAQQRIKELEKQLARTQVENDLLKKARRFLSEGKARPMPTSKGTGKNSR